MPKRRVLMLTAAWPPVARVGARRPLRLARRLPDLGWTPVVLTPEPSAVFRRMPAMDPTLAVPPVEVHRIDARVPSTALHHLASRLPARAARLFRRALADALMPDQYVEWAPAAVRAARRINPVDVVWVTGGPFGMFVAGALVARALGRPLVLDYRDPWTVDPVARRSPLSPPTAALRALERQLLRAADGISYVNADMRDRNRATFGAPAVPCAVIPNGFDPLDVVETTPLRPLRPTLLYTGACYGSRSMKPVLTALQAGPVDQIGKVQLQIFGELDPGAAAYLEAHPMPDRVGVEGRIPSLELAGRLRGADALLLLVGNGHRTALTAKVFDYLLAGRPIVGYGPADCAAAELVQRCGVGIWTHDGAGLIDALGAVQRRAVPYARVSAEVRRYSADVMAERTVTLLDDVYSASGS